MRSGPVVRESSRMDWLEGEEGVGERKWLLV